MSNEQSGIDWAKAITAGAVATAAMTIVGMILKMDVMKMLGEGMVGQDGGVMVYVVGGLMHLMIGIVYGVIYSVLAPKVPLPSIARGLLFGAILTPVAMTASPMMMKMMPNAPAGNPCNPCGGGNPCGAIDDGWTLAGFQEGNPCNPCNPCGQNPCGGDNPCSGANPCAGNPCSANAGDTKMNPWIGSGISHLIYGLVLGLLYRPKPS